jgi:hypothetical protein
MAGPLARIMFLLSSTSPCATFVASPRDGQRHGMQALVLRPIRRLGVDGR